MTELAIKIKTNLDELLRVTQKATTQIEALKVTLEEINDYKLKVEIDRD